MHFRVGDDFSYVNYQSCRPRFPIRIQLDRCLAKPRFKLEEVPRPDLIHEFLEFEQARLNGLIFVFDLDPCYWNVDTQVLGVCERCVDIKNRTGIEVRSANF
jgi:hypothetical protein